MPTIVQRLQQVAEGIRLELEEGMQLQLQQQQQQQCISPSKGAATTVVPTAADNIVHVDQQHAPPVAAVSASSSPQKAGSLRSSISSTANCNESCDQRKQMSHSLMGSCTSPHTKQSAVLSLLKESPALLMACSSQLAAKACQDLRTMLEETEQQLCNPDSWANPSWGEQQQGQQEQQPQQQGQQQGRQQQLQGAAACPYSLPWMTPASCSLHAVTQQGVQPVDLLVKQRQQLHVELFVQAKTAMTRARAADQELTKVLGTTALLQQEAEGSSTWEGQLALLWMRKEGLKAEVAVLEQRRAEFVQVCQASAPHYCVVVISSS
jgi:hypothetical protein